MNDQKNSLVEVVIRLEDVVMALSKIASRLEEIKYEK